MGADASQETLQPEGVQFVEAPNYTPLPNPILDELLESTASQAEFAVTMALCRETFRWKREESQLLSVESLQDITGLSRPSVAKGLAEAEARGWVGHRRKGNANLYGLRVKKVSSSDPATEDQTPKKSGFAGGSGESKETLRGDYRGVAVEGPESNERQDGKKQRDELQEPFGFSEFLEHHKAVTGHTPPGEGTKARKELAGAYARCLAEVEQTFANTPGFSGDCHAALRFAADAAHADDYRRENGYDVAASVLRVTKVGDLINRGLAARRNGRRAGAGQKPPGEDWSGYDRPMNAT